MIDSNQKEILRNLILNELSEIRDKIHGMHFVVNENNVNNVKKISDIINEYCKNDEYRITTSLFEPTLESGSITITGENVCLPSELLKTIMNLSREFEIVPYSDGKVSLVFGFYGLSRLEKNK